MKTARLRTVTGGPAEPALTLTLTDSDTTTVEVMGWVEVRQVAGGAEAGAPLRPRFFEALPGPAPAAFGAEFGAPIDYRVTATDLPSGFWKGRLVLAGPQGTRVTTPFAVALDGRHLTCGTRSRIGDTVTLSHPAGPRVDVSRS